MKEVSLPDLLGKVPPGEPVPAISLCQPWAAAVAFLDKNVENRSRWPFKYRGPILIHASTTRPTLDAFARLREIAREDEWEDDIVDGLDPETPEKFIGQIFDFGAIVAVANLADVFGPDDEVPEDHPVQGSPWANENEKYWLYFSEIAIVEPVPFKGAVGMFKVPYAVVEQLRPRVLGEEGAPSDQ